MFALCIESSHARGMGHFYRALNLAKALQLAGQQCKFFLNEHAPSIRLLEQCGHQYETVRLPGAGDGWEEALVHKNKISLWINDRMNTEIGHAQAVKACNIPLVTFDDRGKGAEIADLHIASLTFDKRERLRGARLLRGPDYLILNPQIRNFARVRNQLNSILVTLGGSDTYGVTVKVVRLLKEMGMTATIVVGPSFIHREALSGELTDGFFVKYGVPSLIEEFATHDLAITGGGITPFEANASGLPCVVIANELFEVPVGEGLQRLGGSLFAGYHEVLSTPLFRPDLKLARMSQSGLDNIGLQGTNRVVNAIMELHG